MCFDALEVAHHFRKGYWTGGDTMSRKIFRGKIGRRLIRFAVVAATVGVVTVSMSAQSGTSESLEAAPTSGSAPLVVTFTGRVPGEYESVVILDFGDGRIDDSLGTGYAFMRTHTYAKAGSYTAELRSGPWLGNRPAVLKTFARVTITVQ